MPDVECHLEEAVLEALLCKLPNNNVINVDVGHSYEVRPVGLLAGSEENRPMFQGPAASVGHPAAQPPASRVL